MREIASGNPALALLSASILFSLSACSSSEPILPSGDAAPVRPAPVDRKLKLPSEIKLLLDPQLTEQEHNQIVDDLTLIDSLEVEPLPAQAGTDGDPTYAAFGDLSKHSLAKFLNERIRYVISPRHSEGHPGFPGAVAANLGTSLWLNAVSRGLRQGRIRFASEEVPITSTRSGIIQVFDDYQSDTSSLSRLATWIHEARHSDCRGGLTRAGLHELWYNGRIHTSCGYMHSKCEEGRLQGIEACDGLPWGAYGIEALFSRGIYQRCRGCTRRQKQEALMNTIHMGERTPFWSDMISGRAGTPDMSSAGLSSDALEEIGYR